MDIACPNCAATYRVPATLLAGGSPLRCVACGHEWVPQAPPPVEAAPPAPVQDMPNPAIPEQAVPTLTDAAPTQPPPEVLEVPLFAQEPQVAAQEATAQEAALPPAPPGIRPTDPGLPPPLQRRGPPHLSRGALSGLHARPRRARLLPVAWVMSVIMVVLMVLGLFLFRDEIAQAWPPFARLASG